MIAIHTPRREAVTDQQIAWAVYLGAHSPKRLAWEWGASIQRASRLLERAAKNGFIVRLWNGRYASSVNFIKPGMLP